MKGYPDEAIIHEGDEARQLAESQLRRSLCMQSLVATITENCDVTSVQILVEQTGGTPLGSMRLRRSFFMDTQDDSLLTDSMFRDESILLTPRNAAQLILDLYEQQDWLRLKLYASTNESTESFSAAMEALPQVVSYTLEGGSVSADGNSVLFTLHLTGRNGRQITAPLRLSHVNGIWMTTAERLAAAVEGLK